MPSRAGSTPSEDAGPEPALGTPPDSLVEDATAGWRARAERAISRFPGLEPDDPMGRYGDLLGGVVAVVALLAMLALDVSPWLAISLAVVTYVAVALMRPSRKRWYEISDGTASSQPRIEEVPEDHEVAQFPELAPVSVEALATRYGLTRREQEVLPLLAQRLTDREIAERLSISHRTAMNHTANILGKLGLASRRDIDPFLAQHHVQPPSAPSREDE